MTLNTLSDAAPRAGVRRHNWLPIAEGILDGKDIDEELALDALLCPDDQLPELLAAAYRLRYAAFGNRVLLNKLINAKSGLCPEDCHYCSQSRLSSADIEKYPLISRERLLEGAREALAQGASTYCIVASGRGPTPRDLQQVCEAVRDIKAFSQMRICCCLGILADGQAEQLKAAGVDRVNHNLNTSEHHHEEICSTHTYKDRVETVEKVKGAGIDPCAGGIIGMGETPRDVVDLAFALRNLDVDSIPVNFHIPIPGTPLEPSADLNPRYCLKVLCMFRLVNPRKEIRIAGGRELHLRSLQPMGLYAANSIFLGDYLTAEGQDASEDHKMLEDLGFEVVAPGDFTPVGHCGSDCARE